MKNNLWIIIITIIVILIIFTKFNINRKEFITEIVENNTDIKIIEKGNKSQNDYDIIVNNVNFYDKVVASGEIGFGESYMDGDWDSKNLEETMYKLIKSRVKIEKTINNSSITAIFLSLQSKLLSYLPNNTLKTSKQNISFTYNDVGNDLYTKMLGKSMAYTCGYFHKPNMTLDEAQYAKMDLVAKKLDLNSGITVLELGCGWGVMCKYIADKYGVKVIGVSLSSQQIDYANKYNKNDNVEYILSDYRNIKGKYDRIFSIGMLEHIGRKNYKEYYDKCYELLNDNGIMLIHTIASDERVRSNNGWTRKYIFPEGELPHLSNLTDIYTDKWYLQDFQNFGLSYAKTLRLWKQNIGNWEGLENYNKKFRRMWEYYLMSCVAAFKDRYIYLYQLVYFKNTTTRLDDAYYIRNCIMYI